MKDLIVKTWIAHLSSPDNESVTLLQQTWRYCQQHPLLLKAENHEMLLARGAEIARILFTLNMESESLAAALLFPFVEVEIIKIEQLSNDFSKSVVQLLMGVMKMQAIRQLTMPQNSATLHNNIDKIRRMLLAMVTDVRCVIIKLAERLVVLKSLKSATQPTRVIAANECMSIYAPLANRLGIGQLKWELEDFCFHYLHPEKYKEIARLLDERRANREIFIDEFTAALNKAIFAEFIKADVYGRPKHIYSIWLKMSKKSLTFNKLFDVLAVRIVVERVEDCYAALGVVHSQYNYLPTEFDDYIANPKPNGYQSIHTIVLGPTGKYIEIQIRTKMMHETAELGVAAHWQYKEGKLKSIQANYEEKINWLRKLLVWQEEVTNKNSEMAAVHKKIFADRIYVFTPQGDVIDLPAGSTPLDFAYTIHTDIGHRCIGAKVNQRIVSFSYILKMADQIEIITQKKPNPSRDWLSMHCNFITTNRARAKINNWFRKQNRDKYLTSGRQMLLNELEQYGFNLKIAEKILLPFGNFATVPELSVAIGSGDIKLTQLTSLLQSHHAKINRIERLDKGNKTAVNSTNKMAKSSTKHSSYSLSLVKNYGKIIISGQRNLLYYLAGCCQPIPGDAIIGYITHGRGISIHQAACERAIKLQQASSERIIKVAWEEGDSGGCSLIIRIMAIDHNYSSLLNDITTLLANEKINLLGVSNRGDSSNQTTLIDITIEIYNQTSLCRFLDKLQQIPQIISAQRLQGRL